MWTGPPIEASWVASPGLRRPGLRLVKENKKKKVENYSNVQPLQFFF
jgi:hypothetical protein